MERLPLSFRQTSVDPLNLETGVQASPICLEFPRNLDKVHAREISILNLPICRDSRWIVIGQQ